MSPTGRVENHTTFECALHSVAPPRPNPVQDVQVAVTFTDPAGRARRVPAFWDGGTTFRVRFAPDQPGTWTYQTRCSDQGDTGLHDQRGILEVAPYTGSNPLYKHGPLRVAADGRHLAHADGTPFFYLADTAWNGPLKADAADWETYLVARKGQGFSAVQVVLLPWLGAAADAEGRPGWITADRVAIDPVYFQRLDAQMAAIARNGLVAAPVLLWAATWNAAAAGLNPGVTLAEDQAIVLARYLLARYGAQPALWLLAGDGQYAGAAAERWRRIGRAVFEGHPDLVATMHPEGQHWVADAFSGEPWYRVIGYQGGHWVEPERQRWLCQGPPAPSASSAAVARPIINLEPCYEGLLPSARPQGPPFDDAEVRRACYTSLLVSTTAGVAYGAHGVWSWEQRPVAPLNHPNNGPALPWIEALILPGGRQMQHLGALFRSLPWWTLRPAPDLLVSQPGQDDPTRFLALAAAADRTCLVAYVPAGARVELAPGALAPGVEASWFDPRTGKWFPAASGGAGRFEPPGRDDLDWVLVARKPAAPGRARRA